MSSAFRFLRRPPLRVIKSDVKYFLPFSLSLPGTACYYNDPPNKPDTNMIAALPPSLFGVLRTQSSKPFIRKHTFKSSQCNIFIFLAFPSETACYYNSPQSKPNNNMIVALPPHIYGAGPGAGNGPGCGTYWEVKCVGTLKRIADGLYPGNERGACTTDKSIIVKGGDLCPVSCSGTRQRAVFTCFLHVLSETILFLMVEPCLHDFGSI